eukprot:gene7479-7543_t
MRFKDIPPREDAPPLNESDQNKIMHVALPILSGIQIMATDMLESMGQKLIEGNNFTISLTPDTKAEADRLYAELSEGVTDGVPPHDEFWGYWGTCKDRFGIRWIVKILQNDIIKRYKPNLMNPKVDFFFNKEKKWQEEIERLRVIALDSGLNEELKWGALLADPQGIMIQQTENVQAARQARFTNLREIIDLEPTLKAYILEAIEVERSGLKVEFKKTAQFAVPEEFQYQLDHIPALKTAFNALTPGRQKGYLLYFSQAKQAKTRQSRIEKYIPQILAGKGLED